MKHPIGNKRLVERNNIELLIRNEFLDELRRFDPEGIVAHESDGKLSTLSLRAVPLHLAPSHIAERPLDALIAVGIILGMAGEDEQLSLAAFGRDNGRVARLGGTWDALRVVVAVIRRQNLRTRPLNLARRADGNGTVAVPHSANPLLDSCKFHSLSVERKAELRRAVAAGGRIGERNQPEVIPPDAFCRLRHKIEARAGSDVAASAAHKGLHTLASLRSERLRLQMRSPARHDKDIRRIKHARSHRLAVYRRRDDILRAGGDFKPAERADVPRTVADKHRNAKRLFVRASGRHTALRRQASCHGH